MKRKSLLAIVISIIVVITIYLYTSQYEKLGLMPYIIEFVKLYIGIMLFLYLSKYKKYRYISIGILLIIVVMALFNVKVVPIHDEWFMPWPDIPVLYVNIVDALKKISVDNTYYIDIYYSCSFFTILSNLMLFILVICIKIIDFIRNKKIKEQGNS